MKNSKSSVKCAHCGKKITQGEGFKNTHDRCFWRYQIEPNFDKFNDDLNKQKRSLESKIANTISFVGTVLIFLMAVKIISILN